MVLLTVIGRRLAKEGKEFTFIGPISTCKECKVKNICFHLEKGSRYRIVSARNVVHECPMHEDGVVVIQVEEVPREAVISKKLALDGSTIKYDTPKCSFRSCENHELCFLSGMENGNKRKVLEVRGSIECPAGQNRMSVLLG